MLASHTPGHVDPLGEIFPLRKTSLPTEIWQIVFQLATEIPLATDLVLEDPFLNYREGHPSRAHYFESLKTKIAISLVSHTWRNMITPYLFEVIRLTRATIHPLVPVLLDPLKGRQRCGCIRRVEVFFSFSGNYVDSQRERSAFLGNLESILLRCSKLEVFCHSGVTIPSDLVASFLQRCGPTLRHLYLGSGFIPQDFAKLLNTQCIQLRTLYIHNMSIGTGSFGERISLPSLRSLAYYYDPEIPTVPTVFSQGHYPNLRHMRYLYSCNGPYPNYPTLSPNMASNIRILDLSRGWHNPPVPDLLSIHTRVETLIFPLANSSYWCRNELLTLTHNHVRRIGIYGGHETLLDKLESIFTRFSDAACFPSIEHFQILNVDILDLAGRTFWERWITKTEEVGIRLDHGSGRTVRSILEADDFASSEPAALVLEA